MRDASTDEWRERLRPRLAGLCLNPIREAVVALTVFVGIAAPYFPARRAARVDPLVLSAWIE